VLPNCRFFAGKDVVFTSIADSAATARRGELVVYRIGKDCPSQLVADAMARGAAGILSEQVLPCPLPQCIVGDIDFALAKLTADQLGHPDRKLLTIGVVGSAGKTSTTLLIASLMRGCGIRTAYQSDSGDCDGVVQSTPSDAIPAGETLVHWLGEACDCQCKAAVIEIADDDARRGQYDAIQFDLVVLTGSGLCSGDFGPSGLQCVLERLSAGGVVIAPADDANVTRVVRDAGARLVTYSVRKAADVTAKMIDQSGGMTTLLVTHHDTSAVMETSLCGPAMAANHVAATTVGLLLGQPLEGIVEKLSQLREIPGRGQRLAGDNEATVVLDAGGTPERVAASLHTYRTMKSGGRLWCILAADGNLAPEFLAAYGKLMERLADQSVVTSTAGTKTSFLSASHGILDGVEKCGVFRLVADRRRAIEWAISEARPTDTILFITGEQDQTAAEQRCDLERIGRWVASARQANSKGREPGPVLKVFG